MWLISDNFTLLLSNLSNGLFDVSYALLISRGSSDSAGKLSFR